jgi:hypothetical protein
LLKVWGVMAKLRSAIFSAAALSLAAGLNPAQAQFAITVPASEVAASLQKTLGDTTIHLHNKGPLTGGTYHQENASSIKVPARVSGRPGQRTRFTIPDESRVVLGRRYGYYIDHVRSTGVFVAAGADTFTLTITLASQGPALVGTCVQLRAPVQACTTFGESSLPPVEWKDARVEIIAKPAVINRKVALDVQSVVIGGTFEVGKVCEFPLLGTRLCASITRKTDMLRARVASQVKTMLNSPMVRTQIAEGVRAYLDTTLNEPLLSVGSIDMADGSVTIRPRLGR